MEKKSFMKKLTGSREALLAVILVLLFVVITIISPSFLTFKSLTDMLKKQCGNNGNVTWYVMCHAGRRN